MGVYLGRVVDDRRDLLGVTLQRGHDLLLALVKHHNVLIGATWGPTTKQNKPQVGPLHGTNQYWAGGGVDGKWADPLTGQHFVGVRRTQVQSQDSRNAGTVQTLREERSIHDWTRKNPNTSVDAAH